MLYSAQYPGIPPRQTCLSRSHPTHLHHLKLPVWWTIWSRPRECRLDGTTYSFQIKKSGQVKLCRKLWFVALRTSLCPTNHSIYQQIPNNTFTDLKVSWDAYLGFLRSIYHWFKGKIECQPGNFERTVEIESTRMKTALFELHKIAPTR